jgi:NADH-quinone oxidoreductase subunit H
MQGLFALQSHFPDCGGALMFPTSLSFAGSAPGSALAALPPVLPPVFSAGWPAIVYDIILVAVLLGAVSLIPLFLIWWERKVSAHIQSRIGPNRVGPIGLLQSVADGIKLLTKEDICPAEADAWLFRLAPYFVFVPPFVALAAIPFAPSMIFEPRLSTGLFWILAVLSVEALGIILAGWGSHNKWSIYGAMREAGQMVSYEVPMGLAILVGVTAGGTLDLLRLGEMQGGGLHTWLLVQSPFTLLAFVVYFVASLASNKRAPFDLPESESELVAGFHTEYSGLRFSFFFFAEYLGMFVVAAIQVGLFLGAWQDPFGLLGRMEARLATQAAGAGTSTHLAAQVLLLNASGFVIFIAKVLAIIFVQMWVRWTLPRPRIDQVVHACVKVLLPLAGVLFVGQAVWGLLVPDITAADGARAVPWVDYAPWRPADWAAAGATGAFVARAILSVLVIAIMGALLMWIAHAAMTAKRVRQRLSEAEPIDRQPRSLLAH